MVGKNLVLDLNAKMLLANHIAGFLNFNISKTIEAMKLIFFAFMYISIKDLNWDWACPGMAKEAIKSLRSQKLKEV